MMQTTYEEAKEFFVEHFQGEHHFPSKMERFGMGWAIHTNNCLSTFDFSNMTDLVIMAHVKCFRVEVSAAGKNKLCIAIWKRKREGSMPERHPTLTKVMEPWVIQEKLTPA